jgi:hypothetical protein
MFLCIEIEFTQHSITIFDNNQLQKLWKHGKTNEKIQGNFNNTFY